MINEILMKKIQYETGLEEFSDEIPDVLPEPNSAIIRKATKVRLSPDMYAELLEDLLEEGLIDSVLFNVTEINGLEVKVVPNLKEMYVV